MIADINESPELSGVLADKTAQVDANMSFSFNANVFNDPDLGDELTYTSTLDNGNLLPSWLSFNPNTITYSKIPPMIEGFRNQINRYR
ncbi:MAG: putative Ig domain-containing protein [Chitinophagales bacterium]